MASPASPGIEFLNPGSLKKEDIVLANEIVYL
jgi:hypothetical protein